MESRTEQRKSGAARGEAPVGPGGDPADGNVDACIPERLRPDGTAAWPPRAAGLGFNVPEEAEPAADEEARTPARETVLGQTRTSARKTAGPTPDGTAAGLVGRGTRRNASGSGEERAAVVRPAWMPERVRLRDGADVLLHPTPEDAVSAGRAETAVPAPHVADGAHALAAAGEDPPAWCHSEYAGPGNVAPAVTAGGVREQAAFFPSSFRREKAGRAEARQETAWGREMPEPCRGVSEALSTLTERDKGERVVGEDRMAFQGKNVQRTLPARLTRPGPAREATPARGESVNIPNAVDFLQEYGVASGAGTGTGTDAGRVALGQDSHDARTDGDVAAVSRRKSITRMERRVRPAAVPALDMEVMALREEKTLQIMDVSPAWNAGLPDLSGVVLAGGAQRKESPDSDRSRMRAVASPLAVPESAPAVQVNATLRVDEEELVCAVERLITRQAQRG